MQLHGGVVGFHSEEGKGSTFYFQIPAYRVKHEHQWPKTDASSDLKDKDMRKIPNHSHLDTNMSSYFNGKKILIVDDSKMIRQLMRKVLVDKGGQCTQAEDGNEAVACVKKAMADNSEFDLIFMDFVMPNMDGPTATSIIKELLCKSIIIGVTGNTMNEDVSYFTDKGALAVFPKPTSITDIESFLVKYGTTTKVR